MKYQKHGYSRHPLYNVWKKMKQRCSLKYAETYEYYAGRGISVCDEWVTNPLEFIRWALRNGWQKGLQIDRINNDGNYKPGNCRFVKPIINNHNQRLLQKNNTSGFRGVYFHKREKKWRAHIFIGGKHKYLGDFKSPTLAAIRYDVECIMLNDNRPLNFGKIDFNEHSKKEII